MIISVECGAVECGANFQAVRGEGVLYASGPPIRKAGGGGGGGGGCCTHMQARCEKWGRGGGEAA